MFEAILLTNAAATLYMVGLIWMVQRVHYPLFDGVGESQFAAYEARHTRAITPIVLPPMVVELATAVGLVIVKTDAELGPVLPGWMPWAGIALVLLVWGVTFCCSVPQHVKLAKGFDPKAYRLLVNTNWLRTAGWTLRGGLVIWMLALVMRG